ncbi:MAG: hypothetical protein GY774_15815 [Planctomycetes bacterium]|nr:hypothetical protein [Planctomycetota bacterium]
MQALDANGQVMHKRFGRAAIAAGYTPFKGEIDSIRFIVEVDAPYFVEGQSVVELRITESLGLFGKQLEKTDFIAPLTVPGSNAKLQTLEIERLKKISKVEESFSDGEYLSTSDGKIRIIRTLTSRELIHRNRQLSKETFVAWTRVAFNKRQGNLTDKDALVFPFRKSSVYSLGTDDYNITTWSASETISVTSS